MKNFYCQFSAFFLCLLTVTQFGYATSLHSDVKNSLKDRNKTENIPAKDRKEIGGKNDRPKKEDIPVNPSKPKRKNTVILPVVSPANTEDVKGITTSLALLPMKGIQPLITNLSTQKMVGPDPFRFTITSNKDSIAVGEEIELTVMVDWVDFGVNNGVRFLPEWYKYALKVVMPKGFLQTGGDYTDYCTKPVNADNPQAVFTIKGKFEYTSQDAKFLVLRGFEGADNLSGFIFKGEMGIEFKNKISSQKEKASRINVGCEITIDQSKINQRMISVTIPNDYLNRDVNISFGDGTSTVVIPRGYTYTHTYCSTGSKTISYWGFYQLEGCSGVTTTNITIPTNSTQTKPEKPRSIDELNCGSTITITPFGLNNEGTLSYRTSESATSTREIFGYRYIPNEGFYLPNGTTWLVSITTCGIKSDESTWKFRALSNPTSVTATPSSISSGATSELKASCAEGTVKWYNVATAGTSLYSGSPYTTNALTANTDFYVSCEHSYCSSERVKVTVTINPCANLSFGVGPATTNTNCGQSTGEISAIASGGTSPYKYKIGSGSYDNTDGIFANLSAGSYDLYVLDSRSCEKSVSVTINSNGGPSDPTDYAGGSRQGPGSIDLTAKCENGITETWYKVATGGTAETTTGRTFATGTISVTTDYYVACKSSTCESGRKKVTATILTVIPDPCQGNPSAPSTTGDSREGVGPITVKANCTTVGSTAQWYASDNTTTVLWYGSDYSTTISSTTTFYASCKKGSCETSKVGATATISDISNPCDGNAPPTPLVTSGSNEGTGSVNIYATCNGNLTRWYANSSGGSPLKTASSSTDDLFTTPTISSTTTFYAVCLNNSGCESGRVGVAAVVLAPCSTRPIAPACTENSREGAGSITIYANCNNQTTSSQVGATTRWYDANNNVIGNGEALTVTIGTTTTYLASCVKGSCESSRSGVRAIVNPCATPTPSPTNKAICGPGTITLYANCNNNSLRGRWYDTPTSTAVRRDNDHNNNSITATISSSRLYYTSCVNPSNNCESPRVGVWAIVLPTTLSTATDAEVCEGTAINLSATNNDSFVFGGFAQPLTKVSTFEWKGPNSYASNVQSPVIPVAQATHNGVFTSKITNTYTHALLNNGGAVCTATATALVTVYLKPTTVPLFTLPSVCREVSGILTATNCASPNTVLWYNSATATVAVGNGTTYPVLIPDNQDNKTFYADCSSKPELQCNSARASQVVSPLPAPPAPTNAKANKTNTCIGSSVTLSGSCPAGQTIQWFNAGGTAMSVLSFNHTAVGVYKYYAGCKENLSPCQTQVANRKEIIVTVNPFPAAPSGASISKSTIFCQDPVPTFNGTCATGQTLRWFTNPTGLGGIITTEPGIYDYYLACQDNVSQCSTIEANRVKVTLEVKSSAPAPVISKLGRSGVTTLNLYPKQATYLEATGCAGCTVEWYEKVGGVYQIMPYENTAFLSIQKATAGTYNYKAKYKKDNCAGGFSNELTVIVAPCPDLVIQQPSPSYVCEDQTIELKVSTTQKGDGTTYQWFSQIQMEDSGPLLSAPTYSKRDNYFAPEGTFFVKSCLAEDGLYYGVSKPVEVKTMYVKPEITPNEVVLVEGANLSLTGTDMSAAVAGQTLAYRWIEPVVSGATLTNNTFSIPNITATKQGVYALTIRKTIGTKECTNTKDISVYVNAPSCRIDFGGEPVYVCENGRGKITVTTSNANGDKTIYYRIDGGEWQTSNEFSNLSDGDYKIEIMERATSLEYADPTACMAVSGSRTVTVECRLPQTEGTFACGDFKVESLIENVVAGTPVTLTARGCGSSNIIDWSNGVNNQSSITVTPTVTTIYSATCQFGNVSSGGSAIVATSGLAKYCLSTQQIKVIAAGGPDDLPPPIPIPPCKDCDNVSIEVTSPIGSSTPNFILVNTTTSSSGIGEIIYPIDLSKYSGTELGKAFYFSFLETEAKEGRTAFNKYAILTAKNCTSDVTWKKGTNTYKGNSLMVRPAAFGNGEYVMSCKKGTTVCEDKKVTISSYSYSEDCSGVTFSTNAPVKSGNDVVLSATGCSGGIVIWKKASLISDLSPKIGVGLSVTIPYPTDASTYTANCYSKVGFGGKLCSKNVTIAPNCPEFKVSYVDDRGLEIKSEGCTSSVEWYNGTTLLFTTTITKPSFYHGAFQKNFKLTAICKATSCTKEIWAISPIVTVTKIDCRKVEIDITGIPVGVCENLVWKKIGREGAYDIAYTGRSYTYNRDEDPTYGNYNVTIGCKDENAKFQTVTGYGNGVNQIPYFYDVVHYDFRLDKPSETPNLQDIPRTKLYPDVNSTLVLTSSCITGTTSWVVTGLLTTQYEISDSRNNKNGIITFKNVDKDFTYTATCSKHSTCPFTENVKINFCPGFTAYASPSEILIGGTSMLFAKNCMGTVTWKNITANKVVPSAAGTNPIVKPTENTTYQATCFTTTGMHECFSNELTLRVRTDVKFGDKNYTPPSSPCPFALLPETSEIGECQDIYPLPNYFTKIGEVCRIKSSSTTAKPIRGGYVPAETKLHFLEYVKCAGVTEVFDFVNGSKIVNWRDEYYASVSPKLFKATCTTSDCYNEMLVSSNFTTEDPDTPEDGKCSKFKVTSYPIAAKYGEEIEIISEGCKSNPTWTYDGKSARGNILKVILYPSSTKTIRFKVDCSNPNCYIDNIDVTIFCKTCRIATPDELTATTNSTAATNATAALVPCGDISNADAMKGYITHLLANIYTALDGKNLNDAEAKAALLALLNSLCGDPDLKSLGINICKCMSPAKITKTVVDKFKLGGTTNFADIATLFSSCLIGNMPIDTYNDSGRNTYPVVYNGTLPLKPVDTDGTCPNTVSLVFRGVDGKFFELAGGVQYVLPKWFDKAQTLKTEGYLMAFRSVAQNQYVDVPPSSASLHYENYNEYSTKPGTWHWNGNYTPITYKTVPTGKTNALSFSFIEYSTQSQNGKTCQTIKIYAAIVYKDAIGKEIIEKVSLVCNKIQKECSDEYITQGGFKNRSGKLKNNVRIDGGAESYVEEKLLDNLVTTLNAKLGGLFKELNGRLGGRLSISAIDVNDIAGKAALEAEANTKGVTKFAEPFVYDGVYIFAFFDGAGFPKCEDDYIKAKLKEIEESGYYSLKTPFEKVLIKTGAFYYHAVVGSLKCAVDEKVFYTCTTDGTGKETCVIKDPSVEGKAKAFCAGLIYSAIDDIDVGSLAQVLFTVLPDMLLKAAKSSVTDWLNYPADVNAFYTKYKANPGLLTTQDAATTGTDVVKVLPPNVRSTVTGTQFAINICSFTWNHYVTDGNYWRSGELTWMVAPIVLSAGTYLVYKGPKLVSRLSGRLALKLKGSTNRLLNQGIDFANFFKAGKKLEYPSTSGFTQVAVRQSDGTIEHVYEQVVDGGQNVLEEICGLCLAQNTKVFGTNTTISEISDSHNTIQTLEIDGTVSMRSILGKFSRKVENYVRIFVGDEELKSSADHNFKTNTGWLRAKDLHKGTLLFSLALNDYVPVEKIELVNESLQVEGLALGNVQGYGVGKLGIVVARSRSCFNGITSTLFEDLKALVGEIKAQKLSDIFSKLPEKYIIKEEDGIIKVIGENGEEWAEFTADKIKAKGGIGNNSNSSLRNQLLNKDLLPNHIYEVDGFRYRTDNLGNVNVIEIDNLTLGPTPVRRDGAEQARAKTLKDGNIGSPPDDGGHGVGAQFNGPVEQINYDPQNPSINQPASPTRGTDGEWYVMEKEWADILKGTRTELRGKPVSPPITNIKINKYFEDLDHPKRASRYMITFECNGEEFTNLINNPF